MKKFLCFALLAALAGCGQPVEPPVVGSTVPQFDLSRADADGTLQSESLAGEIVVLNFWSTSCLVCLQEIEELKKLHAAGRAKVIGIALDDDRQRVKKMIQARGIEYPVVMGDEATFERFDGYSIPYTLVIDRSQVIRKKVFGPFGEDEMSKLLQAIDAGREVALAGS